MTDSSRVIKIEKDEVTVSATSNSNDCSPSKRSHLDSDNEDKSDQDSSPSKSSVGDTPEKNNKPSDSPPNKKKKSEEEAEENIHAKIKREKQEEERLKMQ